MEDEKNSQLEELEKASEEFNDLIEKGPSIEEENVEEQEVLKEQEELKTPIEPEEKLKDSNKSIKKLKSNNKTYIIKSVPIIIVLLIMIGFLIHWIFGNDKKVESPKTEPVVKKENIHKKRDEIMNVPVEEDVQSEEIEKIEEEKKTDSYKEYEKLSEEEKKEIEFVPRKEEVPIEVIEDIKEDLNYDETKKIPEKFNLAEKIEIKVENQGSFGLCWDFASLNTLETNLALKHNKVYDFSEIHVDYMTSDYLFGYRTAHDGGSFLTFESYFTNSGAVLEDKLEYRTYEMDEIELFPSYSGDIKATETVAYPGVYLLDKDAEDYEEQLKEYRNVIKTHIMTNGALYAGINSKNFYNDNKNLYSEEKAFSDHAITIVGWDDTYSKDNFKLPNGHTPEHDGAYIGLNSWGSGFGDGGYFYISYDDANIEDEMNGVIYTSLDSEGYVDVTKLNNKHLKELFTPYIIEKNNKKYISKLDLSNLQVSNLSNKNITNEDLIYVNYLGSKYLDLSENKITDISNLNLKEIYYLNLSDNNIKSLDGIDFGRMSSLNVSNNPISSLEGLDFKNITSLDLSGTNVSDLSSLNNSNVTSLILNRVKTLDINTIPKELNILYLEDSNITSLPKDLKIETTLLLDKNPNIDISTLPEEIYSVYLNECELEDISNISLKKVDTLELKSNNISDITPLKDIEIASFLSLSDNPIEDLSPLKDPDRNREDYIYQLDIERTKINNIENLNNLPFEFINAEENNISDVTGFKGELLYLNLSKNPIQSDISSLKNVEYLVLNDININNIEIEEEMHNEYLSLNNNDIEDLSFLSKFVNLEGLSLQGNKKLPNKIVNERINELNLSECNIKDFDVSGLPALTYLNLIDNKDLNIQSILESRMLTDTNENLHVETKDIEVTYEDFKNYAEKYKDNLYVSGVTLVIHASGNGIALKDYPEIRYAYNNDIDSLSYENGYYDRNTKSIMIKDASKKRIFINPLNVINDIFFTENVIIEFD